MQYAHKYNLKVEFEDGYKWDLNILAVNADWLKYWTNSKQDIKSLQITLIKKNFATVKDDFGATAFNEDNETLPRYQYIELLP